jgi:hypothetical protein
MNCSKKERKKETSLCDFRGRSIVVGLKKKKSRPTDPNFEDPIGNTHIFFWPKHKQKNYNI